VSTSICTSFQVRGLLRSWTSCPASYSSNRCISLAQEVSCTCTLPPTGHATNSNSNEMHASFHRRGASKTLTARTADIPTQSGDQSGICLVLRRNVFKRCGAARSFLVHIFGKFTCSCIDGSAHLQQHLAHSLSSFGLYASCPASYCSHRCISLAQKLSC